MKKTISELVEDNLKELREVKKEFDKQFAKTLKSSEEIRDILNN